MPELPEVEHVARQLSKVIVGKTIERSRLLREKLAPETSPVIFDRLLRGATVMDVGRRGKHILIGLDNGRTLIVHLRMSGRFILLWPEDENPKFSHALFHFSDESRVVFQDQRHFGFMKIVETAKLKEARELVKLAPEPFSPEFSSEYLANKVRGSDRVLKGILIDQTKVCGVGNIYASEALFLSGINPKRRGRSLSRKRCEILFHNVRLVLRKAIESIGARPPHPFIIGEGIYGNASDTRWLVYDRAGEPCNNCGSAIKRIKQGAKSTYYCSRCQR